MSNTVAPSPLVWDNSESWFALSSEVSSEIERQLHPTLHCLMKLSHAQRSRAILERVLVNCSSYCLL